MSEDMQMEIAELKSGVKNIEGAVQTIGADLTDIRGAVRRIDADVTDLRGTVQTMGADLTDLRGTVRRLAIKVAHHDERFDQIDEKLKKLDVLDQIKSSMDAMTGELRASRAERSLFEKSFRDQ